MKVNSDFNSVVVDSSKPTGSILTSKFSIKANQTKNASDLVFFSESFKTLPNASPNPSLPSPTTKFSKNSNIFPDHDRDLNGNIFLAFDHHPISKQDERPREEFQNRTGPDPGNWTVLKNPGSVVLPPLIEVRNVKIDKQAKILNFNDPKVSDVKENDEFRETKEFVQSSNQMKEENLFQEGIEVISDQVGKLSNVKSLDRSWKESEGLETSNSFNNPQLIPSREVKRRRFLKQHLPELSLEVIKRHRSILNQLGEIQIISEVQYELKEKKYVGPYVGPLRLYLIRKGEDQERPMMPCSNGDFLKDNLDNRHGYEEPIRDRNKNWREVLWTEILPALKDNEEDLERKSESDKPTDWAEKFKKQLDIHKQFIDGVLMSKIKILRLGIRLGEKPMIVTMYGMGIAGRVYMEHPQFPRHLLVEAYCPLDLSEYSLRIEMETLVELFQGKKRRLLDPGHKRELCGYIVRMIWLDTDEDELKIGPEIQLSSAERRRREREEECRKKEEAGLASQKALERKHGSCRNATSWKDHSLWKRNQAMACRLGTRIDKHNLIISIYSHIRCQTTYILHVYDPVTSHSATMPVSVREIARLTGEEKKIDLWDNDTKASVCRKIVPLIELYNEKKMTAIKLGTRVGIPGPMFRVRLSLLKVLSHKEEPSSGIIRITNQLNELAEDTEGQQLRENECGRAQIPLYKCITPLRNIAKGEVLACGSTRISGNHFIYTVYHVRSKLENKMEHTYNFCFYCVSTCKNIDFQISEEDMYAYMKTKGQQLVVRERLSKIDHVNFSYRLIKERVKICDPQNMSSLHVNRLIYKNCCRIYDRRFQPKTQRNRLPPGIYCMATVTQKFGNVSFNVFEPKSCKYLRYDIAEEEGKELIKEFAFLSPLEMEIQLNTQLSMMVIDKHNENGNWFLDMLDMDNVDSEDDVDGIDIDIDIDDSEDIIGDSKL